MKQFSVTAYYFKNTSPCLRSPLIIRVIICGLVCDLHEHSDAVDEDFCRKSLTGVSSSASEAVNSLLICCSANAGSSSLERLFPWDCSNSSTSPLWTPPVPPHWPDWQCFGWLHPLILPTRCCILLTIASSTHTHTHTHTVQTVWSYLIAGWSGIIYGFQNVIVFPKLPDGLFIFTTCFLMGCLCNGAVGFKILYYSLFHWLY